MIQKPFSFKDRAKSFSYAFNGIAKLLKYEHNSRIHFTAAILVCFAGFYFNIDRVEWLFVIVSIGLVILCELFNTAIERIADFVEPNWNESIGIIKDYASGAVLVASVMAVLIGGIVFIPRIMLWID